MARDPLLGVRVKLKRAKEHLTDLQAKVRAFLDRGPYRVIRDEKTEPGQHLFRVQIRESVPAEWGAIVGDAIHNMRSALDLLACEMVVANGATPDRTTQFPFAATQAKFAAKGMPEIQAASQKARRLVARLKPYNGGNDALWRIHELDIRDKHRLLVPVGASHAAVALDIRVPGPGGQRIKAPAVHFRPLDRQFPLEDGAVLLRGPANSPNVGSDHQFTFEIAFGEGEVFEGEPLFPTLDQLAQLLERVVGIFERHIFR
jgi:hypothetical protein